MANDISTALGFGSTVDFRGKTYQVSPWKYKIQAAFEAYMKDQAYRTVRDMKQYSTDSEYRELQLATARDVAGGYYAFGGEAIQRALNALPHAQHLFWLCLKENHPEITPEVVQEMFQEKMEEMMKAMAEANDDPNLQSPVASVGQ